MLPPRRRSPSKRASSPVRGAARSASRAADLHGGAAAATLDTELVLRDPVEALLKLTSLDVGATLQVTHNGAPFGVITREDAKWFRQSTGVASGSLSRSRQDVRSAFESLRRQAADRKRADRVAAAAAARR